MQQLPACKRRGCLTAKFAGPRSGRGPVVVQGGFSPQTDNFIRAIGSAKEIQILKNFLVESLILAQDERWRRA